MALITAAQAREAIPELTGTGEDTLLGTLIAAAGALMAAYCRFPPASAGASPTLEFVSYTHYFDGPDDEIGYEARELSLRVRPIVSITSVHDDPDWEYGSGDEYVEDTDFLVDDVNGVLHLLPTASKSWSRARRAQKVVYVAGYNSTPAHLAEAAKLTVAWLYRHPRLQGLQQLTTDGVTQQVTPDTLPGPIQMLLAPTRLWEVSLG